MKIIPGNADLGRESLVTCMIENNLHDVNDGEKAMQFLRMKPPYSTVSQPDSILLVLNLPRKDGCDVLAEIKQDDNLKPISVVTFSSSQPDESVVKSYNLHANYYIAKPLDLTQLTKVVQSIQDFWQTIIVKLPDGHH